MTRKTHHEIEMVRLSSGNLQLAGVLVVISAVCMTLSYSAVIRDDDPRPWFDRGHHDRYIWSRELGHDYLVTETAYAPRGYKFVIMKSRDSELKQHGYRHSASYYDFSGQKSIAVITVKGPKDKRPCLVTDTELTYKTAMADLADRNGSTAATSLKPVKTLDGTAPPLGLEGELELFKHNPGLRAACQGRHVIDTRHGPSGTGTSENSRTVKVLVMDVVVNIVQLRRPATKSRWRRSGFFDL